MRPITPAALSEQVKTGLPAQWRENEMNKLRGLEVNQWVQVLRDRFSCFEPASEDTTSSERMSVAYAAATG